MPVESIGELEPAEADLDMEAPSNGPSGLSVIHRGRKVRARRLVFYGLQGVGKSTFAASAPNPIFIPTEDGIADLDVASFPIAKTYQEVLANLKTVLKESHDFKTVVIDTLDWLEPMLWKKCCLDKGVDSIEKIDGGYGKGYAYVANEWMTLLNGLDRIRDRGINVILLAHSHTVKVEQTDGPSYDQRQPKLQKTSCARIVEWADEVFFAGYKVLTVEDESNKKRNRGVGGNRIVLTTPTPPALAKCRLTGVPAEIPLKWEAYASHWPK